MYQITPDLELNEYTFKQMWDNHIDRIVKAVKAKKELPKLYHNSIAIVEIPEYMTAERMIEIWKQQGCFYTSASPNTIEYTIIPPYLIYKNQ